MSSGTEQCATNAAVQEFKRFKQFYLVEKCSYCTSVFSRYRRRQDRSDAIVVALSGLTSLIVIAPGSPMWSVYLAAVLFSIGHSAGTPTYGAVIADIFSGFCFAISGLAIHACLKWHARHSAQQPFRS